MDLLDALDWITVNAASGGNYMITLGRDHAIPPTELNYGGKNVTLTLKSAGGQRKITFEGASPSYPLFTVTAGVTLALEDGLTLIGTQNGNAGSIVKVVARGRFVMNGGSITGNRGSGVLVESGAFTMNNGSISGNTQSGVYVMDSGAFTMSGGTISGNTADSGGGVFCSTFTMTGGEISGNTSRNSGGGVYAGGTFTKSGGGVIYGSNAPDQANRAGSDSAGHAVYANRKKRNTTARAATVMDSGKDGPSGGWE
jgi:predicted outer membrane repeat protein